MGTLVASSTPIENPEVVKTFDKNLKMYFTKRAFAMNTLSILIINKISLFYKEIYSPKSNSAHLGIYAQAIMANFRRYVLCFTYWAMCLLIKFSLFFHQGVVLLKDPEAVIEGSSKKEIPLTK